MTSFPDWYALTGKATIRIETLVYRPYRSPSKLPPTTFALIVSIGWIVSGCSALGTSTLFGDGENTSYLTASTDAASGGTAGTAVDSNGIAGITAVSGAQAAPPKDPRVCVFDYDLTLSSHDCAETERDPSAYFCRTNVCDTYGWYPQCLAENAREAVAECVRRGAYIGIASKADVDYCWNDKVLPILEQDQFPELTQYRPEPNAVTSIDYPALDDRNNWNCADCAYTMDGGLSKPDGIRRVMRHYGLDPDLADDRARVIFWDDTRTNITDVQFQLPEVRAILVPSNTGSGVDGGCGITSAEIDAGWAP